MKKIIFILGLSILLFSACSKGELVGGDYPEIVSVNISMTSSLTLEALYKGESLGSIGSQTLLLDIEGESEELIIRELESKKVILTKEILPTPEQQYITIYYDGDKVYDSYVRYEISGYALSGTLEIVLDGNVITQGTAKIDEALSIYFNEGDAKELEIRVQGESEALITRTIDKSYDGKPLRFFYDGTTVIDKLPELVPPSTPENMSVTAQFNPDLTGTATFNGDSEVDFVFYIRSKALDNNGDVTGPVKRITVPTDGTFFTFELTPLPGDPMYDDYVYTFDICKKGSDEMPYSNFIASTAYSDKATQSKGFYGKFDTKESINPIYFTAGSHMLLLGPNAARNTTTKRPYDRVIYGKTIQNLSKYFE